MTLSHRLLAIVSATLLGLLLFFAVVRWGVPRAIDGPIGDGGPTARTRAWFTTSGFYPPELDMASGFQFSWTGSTAALVIPHLDRSRGYRLTVDLAAGRPPNVPPPPEVRFAVDGMPAGALQSTNDRQSVIVYVPVRTGGDGTVVSMDVLNTFVPGPQDTRALGVHVDNVTLAPTAGHFQAEWLVTLRLGLVIFLCGVAVLLCGFAARGVFVTTTLMAAAIVWLFTRDGAFMGPYIGRLEYIAAGAATVGALVAIGRRRWAVLFDAQEWPLACGFVLAASTVKLMYFGHPLANIGDAIFQAHRAQSVHGGQYFFTSITPRPFFEFPYAIALYVNALPFWRWFPTTLDLTRLLRGLALGADALVGVAMYFAARRQWKDRRIALACALLWPFVRVTFDALNTANLTNVYGQGVFGVGLASVGWMAAGGRASIAGVIAAAVLIAIGFLSHFSTLSVGVPLACAVGAVLLVFGDAGLRRLGVWVLAAALAAAAASYVVYYSHFTDVYRKTAERVVAREGEAATGSMVAPPAIKAERWVAETTKNFGLPLLAVAAVGAVLLLKRRDGLTLVLAAWAGTWAMFTLMGIATPLEMRANLAAAPLLVVLSAYGLGTLANRSRLWLAAAWLAALVIICDGLSDWMMALGMG